MAFNPLEKLKNGDYEFIYGLTESDIKTTINSIRNSNDKNSIINGFIKYKKYIMYFSFDVIYDIEQYKEEVFELLKQNQIYDTLISENSKICNILYKTSWGRSFVLDNLDEIIEANINSLGTILAYIFNSFDNNQDFIKKLYLHKNLHVRFLFMKYLVKQYPEKLNLIYDDITKYLTSYTHQEFEQLTFLPNLMANEDIHELAITIFESKLDKSFWYKIKEFILKNYKENSLAKYLLHNCSKSSEKFKEFKNDADRFFETSNDYKIQIYNHYCEHISIQILQEFERYLKCFNDRGKIDEKLKLIIQYGLWDELKKYIDKYLSLSEKKDYQFLKSGSTASCYRIGDYVFKLNKMKWSYEDEICPNLYLILKNLEEHFIRNEEGHVVAGIEVQKFLTKSLSKESFEVTKTDVDRFKQQLKKLGYCLYDTVVGGMYGDNCMLLDSYKDADCQNPESLSEEFKKKPLVLIDRDLVFKTDNLKPKCLLGFRY